MSKAHEAGTFIYAFLVKFKVAICRETHVDIFRDVLPFVGKTVEIDYIGVHDQALDDFLAGEKCQIRFGGLIHFLQFAGIEALDFRNVPCPDFVSRIDMDAEIAEGERPLKNFVGKLVRDTFHTDDTVIFVFGNDSAVK